MVKLGGNELDRAGWLGRCARALAQAGPVVVVHGGGRAVSALSRRLRLPVEQREGLRVTSVAVAEAVEMALAGPISRAVVSALRAEGLDAVGLAGVDGGLLVAQASAAGLGHVGEVTAVRADLLASLLRLGLTPVVAPMAPAADGGVPLNVNADHAAAAIAGALGAAELLLITDVAGVAVQGTVAATIAAADIPALIDARVATDGMAAKLRAAAHALARGARQVRIGDWTLLTTATAGTRVLAAVGQAA